MNKLKKNNTVNNENELKPIVVVNCVTILLYLTVLTIYKHVERECILTFKSPLESPIILVRYVIITIILLLFVYC